MHSDYESMNAVLKVFMLREEHMKYFADSEGNKIPYT